MSAKEALIWDVNRGMSVSDAAEAQGVSRSCAHKWVARYRELGQAGLEELSRAPANSPNRTPQVFVDELLELKQRHPAFGPAKLAVLLAQRHGKHVMAVSTVGEHLLRYGLVKKQSPRNSPMGPIERRPFEIGGAGHSMTTDYKGQIRIGNRARSECFPLTIADPFSRYVFAIDALTSTNLTDAKKGFEHVFREFGTPAQMISDNGSPFCCSRSLGGLTQLSRWWIEHGIVPIRIKPGHPQQNGIHERMHRTLKDWIRLNPQSSMRAQQRSFDAFRHEFNHVRPHQSLGQNVPASALKPYRAFSSRPPEFEYDTTMEVRSVRSNGQIQWDGTFIFASEVLAGTSIGLLPIGEATWSIHFGAVRLGYLDGLTRRVQNHLPGRLQPTTPQNDLENS
jgi:transposase InsO family protein